MRERWLPVLAMGEEADMGEGDIDVLLARLTRLDQRSRARRLSGMNFIHTFGLG